MKQKKIKQIFIIIKIFILLLTLSTCENNPTNPIIATHISLNHTTVQIQIDESITLIALLEPSSATNNEIIWTSDNQDIATVSANGVVTAISKGYTTITASLKQGGLTAKCSIISGYEHDINYFTVYNSDQWDYSVNIIKALGNDRSYTIDIFEDIEIDGVWQDEFTFGDVTGITVNINGKATITRKSRDLLLSVGILQSVIINDLTLNGYYDDYNFSSFIVVVDGIDAIFTMQGNSVANHSTAYNIWVRKGGCFYLKENASVLHGFVGVFVSDSGTFYLQDNATVSFTVSTGVVVNGGFFYMNGGEISMNRNIYRNGLVGGVAISKGQFILSDGIINGNFATNSGGVYIGESGSFEMLGGIISGNRTLSHGGGVFVDRRGFFAMSGGIIYGNEESGSSIELANSSAYIGAAIFVYNYHTNYGTAYYGDGTDILPHTDGYDDFTDYTVIGRR
ncbi:MAG: Ig-like domain-containing protein [Candidatus Cloacimonetes bacterium]|nr:Ig-like domain-containing protein [Candidatus Cloacimonadota bacterium]